MGGTVQYIIKSFGWGVFAKFLDSGIKFFTVSYLIKYFGKEDYALIAVAMSVNAYLQLLDMGVNTGAIKYFSSWIAERKMDLLDSVVRISIFFYGMIGLINALVLILVAFFGMSVFSITIAQEETLKIMFLVLAAFSILNWSTSVFNQLLTANGEVYFVQQVNIVRSLLSLVLVFLTIWFKWNVDSYFIGFTIVNTFSLAPFYWRSKKRELITTFLPKFDWGNFRPIWKYSLAILAMGVFSMSAVKLRPIILSIFSDKGIGIVTEYRVMETITIFILSIGSMSSSIFLPKTSEMILNKDQLKIERFVYEGTLFISIICTLLCLPIVICSNEILTLYVGREYTHLSMWLSTWVITILCTLHNTPVSSLVLATGKTKMLVYSTAISCLISLGINALLCNHIGVGSAVLGYSVYIFIQMAFYYLYFNNKVLNLDSLRIFKSFIYPAALGMVSLLLVNILSLHNSSLVLQMIIKCILFLIFFIALLLLTNVISIGKIKGIIASKGF